MNTLAFVRRHGTRASALALAFAIAMALGTVAPAAADELTELKQQLEAARRSIDSLSQRIQVLETERRAAPAAAPAVAAAPAPAAPVPVVEGEKPSIDIYGFVMLDAIYDFNQMDPNWKDTLRATKIPVNCPGDTGCGKDGKFLMSVRQSRFGIKGLIPTDLGTLNTKLEFELYGVGNDEGKRRRA